jgi:hypothetical protein
LLLRCAALGVHRSAGAAAAAASSAAFRLLLLRIERRTLLRRTLLLLRRTGALLLLRRALLLLLLLLLGTFPVAPAWLLALLVASAAAASRLVAIAAAFLFPRAAGLAGALLELADLLLHVAARLGVLPGAQLVVTAVGAALPPLGIGALTAGTQNGFWKRHRKSARIVHFGLWMTPGAVPCWR